MAQSYDLHVLVCSVCSPRWMNGNLDISNRIPMYMLLLSQSLFFVNYFIQKDRTVFRENKNISEIPTIITRGCKSTLCVFTADLLPYNYAQHINVLFRWLLNIFIPNKISRVLSNSIVPIYYCWFSILIRARRYFFCRIQRIHLNSPRVTSDYTTRAYAYRTQFSS